MSGAEPSERFWAKVEKTKGCWNWTGAKTRDGYGRFRVNGREVMAARFAYEEKHGPLEKRLKIGRTCENPSCVRPDHLYAGTVKEITLRGMGPTANNAAKTMCKHGHLLEGENLVIDSEGRRRCRECAQDIQAERWTRFQGPKRPKPGRVVLRMQMERMSFVELGEHYGVSDTTVRNWAKSYDLH